jgi:cytochrome c peroxidase
VNLLPIPLVVLLALAASDNDARPPLPKDDLSADFGATLPAGVVAKGFVDAPPKPEALKLGRALFFDPILSIDRTVACASCHDPAHGFADPAPISLGINGQRAVRHTPSLFNRGFGKTFSWTGNAPSLEAQVLLPIANPREMGLSLSDMVERLGKDDRYAKEFKAAYSDGVTMANVADALTAFVSRIHHGGSAVDRFQESADFNALDDKERTGLWLYESKAGCWRCHSGPNFSDESFHDTGVGAKAGVPEDGRFAVTEDASDKGRFKTPTLRGLALTAPYMHDGSVATIEDVVAYYRKGANKNANLDERIQPLALSDEEAAALAAFLRALSRPADVRK